MLFPYAGPRRRIDLARALDFVGSGWVAQEKADGCYCAVSVGSCWRSRRVPRGGPALRADLGLDHRHAHNQRVRRAIVGGLYRSGRSALPSFGPLYGLELPGVPEGSVLACEMMAMTPAAGRWCAARGVPVGLVVFDCLAWGGVDVSSEPQARRRALCQVATRGLEGPAAAMVALVEERRVGVGSWYREIVNGGGEGLVLKDPGAAVGCGAYKLKRADTCDARVVQVRRDEGSVLLDWGGVQFSAAVPAWPVEPGDVVAVRSMGHYDSGVPRHAVLERPRPDLQ